MYKTIGIQLQVPLPSIKVILIVYSTALLKNIFGRIT